MLSKGDIGRLPWPESELRSVTYCILLEALHAPSGMVFSSRLCMLLVISHAIVPIYFLSVETFLAVFFYIILVHSLSALVDLDEYQHLMEPVRHMEVSLVAFFTVEFLARMWSVGANGKYQGLKGTSVEGNEKVREQELVTDHNGVGPGPHLVCATLDRQPCPLMTALACVVQDRVGSVVRTVVACVVPDHTGMRSPGLLWHAGPQSAWACVVRNE